MCELRFSCRELHTEKMNWRNGGGSEGTAVIRGGSRGEKAGEDFVDV